MKHLNCPSYPHLGCTDGDTRPVLKNDVLDEVVRVLENVEGVDSCDWHDVVLRKEAIAAVKGLKK